jgi:hypothetical protein
MKNYFFKSITFFALIICFTACSEDDDPEVLAPTITSETTNGNVEITYTTIKISGNVSSDGGSQITSRGVCWSTNQNPTVSDNKTIETSNTFTSTITDLVANTTYYFRVYATNSVGTSYATEQTFRTSSLDDTTWDFLLIHSANDSWHADVLFNADGTTVYDEPSSPGTYLTNGTWSLNGNVLTYDMDSSSTNTSYQFTGTLSNNTMSGTFTFGTDPDKTWSAVKY